VQAFAAAVGRFLRSSCVPEKDAEQLRRSAKSIGTSPRKATARHREESTSRLSSLVVRAGEPESLRCLLDDQLTPPNAFYAAFSLDRTIVKTLSEQIVD